MEYIYSNSRQYMTASWGTDIICLQHIHRNIEIVIVTEGTMVMPVQGKIVTVPERSAVLIPPYTMHGFTDQRKYTCCIMEFPPEFTAEFLDFLHGHEITEPVLRINSALLSYILSRIPHEHGITHYIPESLAHAVLTPLCYEFMTCCAFIITAHRYDDLVIRALNLISNHFNQSITLSDAAKTLGVRPETLTKKFKEHTGLSFWDYVLTQRVTYAMTLLRRGKTVTEAAFDAGFNSIRSFNRVFLKKTGQTPSVFLKTKSGGTYDLYEPEFAAVRRE